MPTDVIWLVKVASDCVMGGPVGRAWALFGMPLKNEKEKIIVYKIVNQGNFSQYEGKKSYSESDSCKKTR